MTPTLQLLTRPVPPDTTPQLRAFLCIRNEADRLPFLLSYYRRLGVDWFLVIDNQSQDGTLDLLRQQSDCSVFHAAGSFAAANFGMQWINALLEQYGIGHWRLFIDADELLVYPHVEQIGLRPLCDYLGRRGYDGLYAFMLDMYSPLPIQQAVYRAGEDFLAACPLFDPDYTFRNRLQLPWGAPRFPSFEVVGGPRLRRLYPEFAGRGLLRYAVPRGLTKLRGSRIGRALNLSRWLGDTASPPLLSKLPLSFGTPGRVYVTNHRTVPLALAPITGALLHFKFFADFHQRVAAAMAEGQHFDGGSEYARYAQALRSDPQLSFAFAGSVHYQDSADLTRRGLLRSDADFDTFCASWTRVGGSAGTPQAALLPYGAT